MLDAPAQTPRGEPLSAGWRAELAIISNATVQVLAPSVPFANGFPASYYVDPQVVEARGYAPGDTVTVRLGAYKGYDSRTAPNYGYSAPFRVALGGGGLLLPANLEGLRGFSPFNLGLYQFIEHPHNQTVTPGADVTFCVESTHQSTLQWRKDGQDILGETNALLTLRDVGIADIGVYSARAVGFDFPPSGHTAPATLSLFEINAARSLTIAGPVGTRYLVEYASQLDANDWTKLTEIILPTNPYTFIDEADPIGKKRFYRAVAVPDPR